MKKGYWWWLLTSMWIVVLLPPAMPGKHVIHDTVAGTSVSVAVSIEEHVPEPPQTVFEVSTVEEFHALDLEPGDTVLFQPGTYGKLHIYDLQGTEESSITLMAAAGDPVVFDGKGLDWDRGGGPAIVLDGCTHLELIGLNATGAGNEGILINKSPNVTLVACNAYNNRVSGIQWIRYSSFGVARACTAYDNREEGLDIEDGCTDMLITSCTAYANGKAGYDIACELTGSPVTRVLYSDCAAYDNGTLVPDAGNGFTMYKPPGDENPPAAGAITYERCRAWNNTAYGIEIQTDSVVPDGRITLRDCIFDRNGGRGGQFNDGLLTIESCVFSSSGWRQEIDIRATAVVHTMTGNRYVGVPRCMLFRNRYTEADRWMGALMAAFPDANVADEILETAPQ